MATLSQYLMAETHDLHMAFMDNAFVNSIWNCTVSKADYAKYHAHLYFIYLTMENESVQHCDNKYFKALYYPKQQDFLNRVGALEQDLKYYYGPNWKDKITPSPVTKKYIAAIKDAASNPLRLLMHQFQRYLADLSGGQTLRVKLTKNFGLRNDDGVNFYIFDAKQSGFNMSNAQYVEYYLAELDKIGQNVSESDKALMLKECVLIYELNHDLYNEMTPNAKPTPFVEERTNVAVKEERKQRSFSLADIQKNDGIKSEKIYVCIDGNVFDVTSGKDSYGPKGGYHLFAGHDITHCLALNSLKKEDLDKFGFEYDEKQKKALAKWTDFFLNKYVLIGRLKEEKNRLFKLEELRKYNGVDKERIYLCVDGIVFDVTKGKEYYGPNGGYHLFAGNDITYSLAVNSLKKEDVNTFEFELTAKQQKALKKWKAFYMKTYDVVGKLNKFYWRRGGKKQSKL